MRAGMRGDDVRWLRQGLEQLSGQPVAGEVGELDAGMGQLQVVPAGIHEQSVPAFLILAKSPVEAVS